MKLTKKFTSKHEAVLFSIDCSIGQWTHPDFFSRRHWLKFIVHLCNDMLQENVTFFL